MIRHIVAATLITCATLILALAFLEAGVRVIGYTDSDGQFSFLNRQLPPYVLPLDKLERELQEYFENKEKVTLIPDAATGWAYRPNSLRQNGEFTINSAGMRARREYDLRPAADTLRIALVGDSFAAADEVRDEEAWGWRLEQMLNRSGLRAEVLNFGVSGYGMGQTLLRWQTQGKDYTPDIVIFVFQAENLERNVNVFRLLHPQGGAVYSKPRFILGNDKLTLVNSPALPPEEILDVLKDFDSHPLAAHEAYYSGRDFTSPLWKASKLAGLTYIALNRLKEAATPLQTYGPASERGQLGKAIIDAFAADVDGIGATFIVLHLPLQDHLGWFHSGIRAPWRFLLDHIQDVYHFINAEDFLGVEYTDASYYQRRHHYGPEINARIADAVSAELLTCIQEATCKLSRFEDLGDIRRQSSGT